MPNWCIDSIAFYQEDGKTDRIEKLAHDFNEAMKRQEGDRNWIGRILNYLGQTEKEREQTQFRCRSFVNDWELRDDHFFVSTDSAWSPVFDTYDFLADHYDVSYEIMAEECGMSYYLNTDVEGCFFGTRYLVSNENDDDYQWEYFSTPQEVEAHLSKIGVTLSNGIKVENLAPGEELEIEEDVWVHCFNDER